MRDLLILAITGLCGGGLVNAIASLINGRSTARKTNTEASSLAAKLPAEVDSVVVQGAEAAVLTMRSALESATRRISELEADRESDRRRIKDLEAKVDQLREKVDKAERALGDARQAGADLRAELEQFARSRDNRA
jgi:Na+/phosphate symporter